MKKMPKIETLTINELMDLFRDYGIPCSFETVTELIEQDKLPFAVCAKPSAGRKRKPLIFKNEAIKWLDERAVGTKP